MDVREGLVQLIGSTEYGNGSLVGNNFQKGFIEKIASNLIAHGVTVQDNTEISDELLKQLRNAPLTVLHEEPTVEVVQEWISVKDRLPQVDTPVIVCGGNGITIDWLEDYGEQGIRWGNLCCGSYNPKYWQPMPQPPKGE